MKEIKIMLTGGGTAGHVFPHLSLLTHYKKANWSFVYVGGNGIEKSIVENSGIVFYAISCGKLRRYFSWKNVVDFFKFFWGIIQSTFIILRERPTIVFSKGGFVSVPVCLAAWLLKVPVVTHESDLSPGLANRIIAKFAKLILCSFPSDKKALGGCPLQWVGSPVRQKLLKGDFRRGQQFLGLQGDKPVLVVMGGSLGAERLNKVLLEAIDELGKDFFIAHLTGQGKATTVTHDSYQSFEFVDEAMSDLLAVAKYVVSRAGANSIFELLALRKPMLLVPLEIGSRGDQVENAAFFVEKKWALSLSEARLNKKSLIDGIYRLGQSEKELIASMSHYDSQDAPKRIFQCLQNVVQTTCAT